MKAFLLRAGRLGGAAALALVLGASGGCEGETGTAGPQGLSGETGATGQNGGQGERVKKVLVEEKISAAAEYYASFSYSTDHRAPVLALASSGGTGTKQAYVFPVDVIGGLQTFFIREALLLQ